MAVALSDPQQSAAAPRLSASPCFHCGVSAGAEGIVLSDGRVFCCSGCRFVYELIQDQGLARFYELRKGPQTPVPAGFFQWRNLEWIGVLCRESAGRFEIEVQGMSCIACVWLIRRVFEGQPGGIEINVDLLGGTARLRVEPDRFQAVEFAALLQKFGYQTGPGGGAGRALKTRGLVLRMGVCGALAMNAMLFTVPGYCGLPLDDGLSALFLKGALGCATASMLVGASYFVGRAWTALRMDCVHMDLPIAVGLLAAYGGSIFAWRSGSGEGVYFDFVSVFTFLMLVGRWVQQAALERNRNRVLQAPQSRLKPAKGEVFTVPGGAPVPVRSLLRSDEALLGMEWISGEAEARHVQAGQSVASGSINLSGTPLELEALEGWSDSLLAKLLEAPAGRAEVHEGVQRFILVYLLCVLLIAAAGFAFWIAKGGGLQAALQVCISVLVVSCPCASGVALPLLADLAATRMKAHGVFVREPGIWSRLLRVRTIVFDKTGTLTGEILRLKSGSGLESLNAEAEGVLRLLVSRSMHPAATSLREALGVFPLPEKSEDHGVKELAGYGLEWRDGSGRIWRMGRPSWVLESSQGAPLPEGTVFGCGGRVVAVFEFEEKLRPGAAEEVRALRDAGYTVHILSGDHPSRVSAVAADLALGAEASDGAQTPEDKARWLANRGGRDSALMLGDGANDSLAFAESLVTGTPAVDRGVLEQRADFYYLGRGLSGVRKLLEMAVFKNALGRRVLCFTTVYNVVVISLALFGRMHPLLASIVMPLSSVVTLAIVLHAFKGRKGGKV